MEIKELLRQSKEIKAQISKLEIKHDNLQQKIFKAFFDKKLYCPIEMLKDFKGKDISSIVLITNLGTKEFMVNNEPKNVFNITPEGKLYRQEYNIKWDEAEKCYLIDHTLYRNYVGFYNLYLQENGKEIKVNRTNFEYLIKEAN